MIDVKVKWGGQMLLFTVSDESKIGDLKQEIYDKTKIKPERQKIIGIKAKDDDNVQEWLTRKNNVTIIHIQYAACHCNERSRNHLPECIQGKTDYVDWYPRGRY